LYNHAEAVLDALESVERSAFSGWEVVVVDDGSSDGGGHAVRRWMDDHPHRPCMLVRHEVNRGLASARNTGAEYARSDRLLMLDADNQLRRIAMARLSVALDADPSASFAYGILDRFSTDGPGGLISWHPWEPQRLRHSNYIDALALIKHDALAALGGYSLDSRLALGWEDYDLWARMAETGRHAAFVPEIVARYRVGHSSMVSVTNISPSDAYAAIADHAPRLMRELQIPL
jgi:glycosyltransferase involved in cell wall biosynthesis